MLDKAISLDLGKMVGYSLRWHRNITPLDLSTGNLLGFTSLCKQILEAKVRP